MPSNIKNLRSQSVKVRKTIKRNVNKNKTKFDNRNNKNKKKNKKTKSDDNGIISIYPSDILENESLFDKNIKKKHQNKLHFRPGSSTSKSDESNVQNVEIQKVKEIFVSGNASVIESSSVFNSNQENKSKKQLFYSKFDSFLKSKENRDEQEEFINEVMDVISKHESQRESGNMTASTSVNINTSEINEVSKSSSKKRNRKKRSEYLTSSFLQENRRRNKGDEQEEFINEGMDVISKHERQRESGNMTASTSVNINTSETNEVSKSSPKKRKRKKRSEYLSSSFLQEKRRRNKDAALKKDNIKLGVSAQIRKELPIGLHIDKETINKRKSESTQTELPKGVYYIIEETIKERKSKSTQTELPKVLHISNENINKRKSEVTENQIPKDLHTNKGNLKKRKSKPIQNEVPKAELNKFNCPTLECFFTPKLIKTSPKTTKRSPKIAKKSPKTTEKYPITANQKKTRLYCQKHGLKV